MPPLASRLPLSYKLAALSALLCALCTLTLVVAAHVGQRGLLRDTADRLGQPLARQLAAAAAGPLLQDDRLSLRALLGEAVRNSSVTHAAIYDLDNQPIVEAGRVLEHSWDYSASITWEDHIGGYAVLSVAAPLPAANQLTALLALFAVLLTALAFAAAVVPGRYLERLLAAMRQRLVQGHGELPRYRGGDALGHLLTSLREAPPPALPSGHCALLYLQLDTDDDAQAQLKVMQAVCRLYDGEVRVCREHGLCAQFSENGVAEDAAFRALCSAQLLRELAAGARQALGYSELPVSAAQAGFAYQRAVTGLATLSQAAPSGDVALDQAFSEREAVQNRSELEHSDGRVRLKSITAPYAALLERQADTLRRRFEG